MKSTDPVTSSSNKHLSVYLPALALASCRTDRSIHRVDSRHPTRYTRPRQGATITSAHRGDGWCGWRVVAVVGNHGKTCIGAMVVVGKRGRSVANQWQLQEQCPSYSLGWESITWPSRRTLIGQDSINTTPLWHHHAIAAQSAYQRTGVLKIGLMTLTTF